MSNSCEKQDNFSSESCMQKMVLSKQITTDMITKAISSIWVTAKKTDHQVLLKPVVFGKLAWLRSMTLSGLLTQTDRTQSYILSLFEGKVYVVDGSNYRRFN